VPASRRKSRPGLTVVPDVGEVSDERRGFASCHADGHSWQHLRNITTVGDTFERISTCGECGTRRRSYYPLSGARPTRRYDYPDGYIAKGENLTKMSWRRIFIVGLG
jgi:hypothetical protein